MNDVNSCVDLANLRDITGGDKELEAELFDEFIQSSHEQIILMGDNTQEIPDNQEVWRQNAHALKGIALTLGANILSNLAKTAQQNNTMPSSDKLILLSDIKAEHQRVIAFLNQITR